MSLVVLQDRTSKPFQHPILPAEMNMDIAGDPAHLKSDETTASQTGLGGAVTQPSGSTECAKEKEAHIQTLQTLDRYASSAALYN